MKWISVFLLIFSTSVFGADYTVYSWGYGDILGETLQMIAFLFHYDDYKDAWKLTLSLALFVGAMATVIPNSDILKVPKIFLLSTGVWTAFAVAQVSIEIDDLTNTGNNKVINGVPWAVGYPMSLISALDYKLGQAYESASSIPATLRYTDGGMMLPLNLFNSSLSYKITDTRLSQNVYNYSIECALPDFDDGIKDYDLAMQSTDLWSYMGGTNPAVLVEYIKSDGTKEVKSCTDAYSSINSDMTTYFSASGKAMQNLATQMGFGSAAAISSKLGTTHQWLHGATASANTMLMQNASINAFNGAFKSYAAMNASNSESLAMYAGKAESVASSNMIVSGILGSKYIPVTKGILMSVVAGLTPMLALIMLTPLAFKSFVGYLTMLMWLATWHLGEIILNHLVSVKAQGVIDAYADSTLTSMTKPLVESTSLDYINMISSMYWMVPTISGLIVGGFSMGALAMMTGGITGRVAKGEAVGSEMGTGSWQSGNIRMDNTTANKHDSTSMLGMGQAYNIQREGFGANNLTTTQGMTSQSNQGVVSGAMQGISQGLNTIAGHHGGGNVGANWSANTQVKNNADGSSYQNGTWTNVGTDGTVTQLSGAMTFGKNGEILSGTGIKYTSTDSSGKTVSGEFDYNNGELTHSKIRNENGTTVETTYNGDGTSTQNVTTSSGSKGTFTIDENGRAKDIKNVDMAQVKATEEYAKQKAVEKATSGVLTEAFKKSFTHSDTEGKDTSVNDTTGYSKDNTTANVAQVSPTSGLNALSGLFKGKGGFGGALANATNIATKAVGVTLTDSDSISTNKSGQLVVTNKDGKTDTYQLDDSSTKQLQQLYAQKESEVSGQKFSTNEPIRNLFKDEQAKNSNETAIETLERMDSNISKTERDLKNGVIASNPEPNSIFANDVKSEIQKVDDATKTDEQITTNGTSVTNNQNPEYQQAKKDFLGNLANASKETQDGVKKEAAVLLSGVAAGLFGSRYAPQIQEAFEKKFSKATDFEKAVNDIEQATKKAETAIETGKGGAGTKKAFEDLGLGEAAKKNGFVFNNDGSVNEKATAFKQNALKAEGKLEETFGNRPQVSKGVEQVGREEFTKRIDEAITHSKDPKEIKGLNALKQDVIDGKPISNKRMANFGFGAGAPVHEPIKVGSTVQAFDKGHSNYGTVTGFNKDGTASVHFKNNTTGNEATAKIAQEDLKNVKSVPQSGNFDFNKAGASIVASNPELKSQVHPSSSVHTQPSVHGNSDVHTPKGGGFFSMVVSTIGLTAFAGAAANADENVGKYVEAGLNLASGAGSLLIPTPLGQGSDLPTVNSSEMAKFTSQFNNQKVDIKSLNSNNNENSSSPKTYNPTKNLKYDPEKNLQTYNPTPNYDPEKSLKQESHKIDKVLTNRVE